MLRLPKVIRQAYKIPQLNNVPKKKRKPKDGGTFVAPPNKKYRNDFSETGIPELNKIKVEENYNKGYMLDKSNDNQDEWPSSNEIFTEG